MRKKAMPPRVKRILLTVLCVLIAAIIITLLLGAVYTKHLLGLINRNPDDSVMSTEISQDLEENDPDFTGPTIDPNDVNLNTNKEDVVNEKHIINLMLIGQDCRTGQGRQRSDVMILCSINTKTKEMNLISFMRDLYVAIPGYEDNRMNATYAFGGMKLLDEAMKVNFGVHLDGNLAVNFDGFEDVVDMIGGVDMYLTASEANHIQKTYKLEAQEGMNHLDGKTALAYVRNRTVGNGDFSRTERQRKLLGAVFEKCKGMSLSQLKALTETVLPLITTDLTDGQILDYTAKILPIVGQLKMNTQQIPADGTYQYASIRGMSVLVPDLEANREILKKILSK